ncbi:unnamed protein product, partial [Amoebophrya sp. A25]|eukprot:GSA25T00004640001.1
MLPRKGLAAAAKVLRNKSRGSHAALVRDDKDGNQDANNEHAGAGTASASSSALWNKNTATSASSSPRHQQHLQRGEGESAPYSRDGSAVFVPPSGTTTIH